MRLMSKGKYAFPGRDHHKECCLTDKAAGLHFRRIINKLGWDDRTTPHDLRRTMRSKLSEIGIPPMIAEKVLNHKIPGIINVYDRHDYLEEKREALQKWSDYLKVVLK